MSLRQIQQTRTTVCQFFFFLNTFASLFVAFIHGFILSLCLNFILLSPLHLLLLLLAPLQSATLCPPHFPSLSSSISLYLSGSCCPPNVLEGSQVGWHCWLHVYFYPTAKRLLITEDKFRSVTLFSLLLSFLSLYWLWILTQILTQFFDAEFAWKSYSSLYLILCLNSVKDVSFQYYSGVNFVSFVSLLKRPDKIWVGNLHHVDSQHKDIKSFGHWQRWATSQPKCWGQFKQWNAASTEVLVPELFC